MPHLPESLARLLDGTALESSPGVTVLVTALGSDGWPRLATLSLGEVLATASDTVLFSLYATSRTTTAIVETGRALLTVVDDGALVKLRLEVSEVADAEAAAAGRAVLRGALVAVDRDEVPYARVTHGIEFELLDPAPALARWSDQLNGLRRLA